MKNSAFLDCSGNVSITLRRLVFGVTALAMLASGGMAVVTRATQRTFNPAGRTERPAFIFASMQPQATPTIAGITKGRVYSAKTPGFASTEHGQAVYNDRNVTDILNAGNPAEAEVEYTTPGSDTPQRVAAKAFFDWADQDVTNLLPPASDGGQLGTGYNWRAYSGAAAQPGGVLANVEEFVPGAGTPYLGRASVEGVPAKSQLAVAGENSEKAVNEEGQKSPAKFPNVDKIDNAAPAPAPAPAPGAQIAQVPTPAPADTQAPANSTLRERALGSMEAKNTTGNEAGRN